MTPFVRIPNNATTAMVQRNTLLAQPPEFFQEFFGGRTPTIEEKLCWVEGNVLQTLSWEVFQNDLYVVVIERTDPLLHLTIRRHDEQPCKDWRHLQQIKNELVGAEYEAVELFPAESRLIDTANEYHLWVHPKAGFRFPFGFSKRRVMKEPLSVHGEARAA